MVVCVAVDNGVIQPHFGHCPEYAFFMVEEEEVQLVKILPNPGHASVAIPPIIREWGVTHVVAGAMGPRAVEIFESMGVEVYTGADGEAEEAVRRLAAGELESRGAGCGHHAEGESCGCGHEH